MPDREETNPAAGFCEYVEAMQAEGRIAEISEDVLRDVISAAIKAYAAKVEDRGVEFPPVDIAKVTATEGVIAVCAIIRAIDLNMFDVNMWFNRSGGGRG